LVRARRKRNAIAGAGFEKYFDVAVGEKRLVPKQFCDEGGFCKLLDSFHSTEGSEKIGAGRDHTVIGHEDGVVVRHKSSEGFAEPGSAWCRVLSQRDTTEQDDDFRQQSFVQGTTGGCKARGDGRMGVTDGTDVGAETVEEKMHGQFRGRAPSTKSWCPSRLVMTRSSGAIWPLQTPQGVVRSREPWSRTDRLPCVPTEKLRS